MANKKVKFELTAIDKTKAAFDKVTKGLKTVGGAAAGAAKGVAGVGLAAGATATALALLVDKSFQAVDAIGKTSTQTGIATDTLQAFHLAARESGTTIEGANTALIKFARSVGDAQRGVKTQSDIFKDLNVNLKNSDGSMRSFDDILNDTAVGITKLGDQTARATALANLFGRQGVILTGAINDLSESGMKKFIQRAKDLGIVLSERVIRRTEEFNDAVGVIKMQLGSFVNNITTAFLPVFEEMQKTIAKTIQSMIDGAGGMDQLGMSIANSIIDASASGIEAVGQLQFAFADFVANLEQLLPKAQISYGNFIADLLKSTPALGNTFGTIADVMLRVKSAELDLAKAERNVVSKEFLNKTKQAADSLRNMKITADDLIDTNNTLNESFGQSENTLTNIQSPMDLYISQIEDVGKTIQQIGVKSMKSFEDAIVTGLKNGKLSFKNFADVVVTELLRVAVQQLVIKNLLNAFGSFKSGLEYDQLTDGDTLFSADGGGYTGMGARAGGVDGKGGFPAILHPNETVIDHTKGQGMGTTVNFNISTVDAAGFDQLLASRKGL
ncbi:MAG: phage tail tape measure C-terminal domain-containing protein, partial [Candidatus Nanopelagicales bacterium]